MYAHTTWLKESKNYTSVVLHKSAVNMTLTVTLSILDRFQSLLFCLTAEINAEN